MAPLRRLSIIVVTWNTRALLQECLESIRATTSGLDVEVIVVDNGSKDETREMLSTRYPQVDLIANERNVGFARANNQAAKLSTSPYLLMLNSDARLLPGALAALLEVIDRESTAAIVGARLLNPDGSFQASHSRFPSLIQEFLILSGIGRLLFGRRFPSRGPEPGRGPMLVDYVEGACLLVRRAAFEQVGGMDEGYFMYAEEVDLCRTVRQGGWQVWYQPAAQVLHLGGASSRNRPTAREMDLYRSRVRYFRKHHGMFQAALLKIMIYASIAAKQPVHAVLRRVSRGRLGRPVVGLADLRSGLRRV